MSQQDSISVIIPAYNSSGFIGDAIESVLMQTVKPNEIIVIDDGSTDQTGEVVKYFDREINYIRQENAGIAEARNRGLELSVCNLIAFLDADDIWVKNKLEIQLNLLCQNPGYEMVIGFLELIPESATMELVEEPGKGAFVMSLGSTLIRRNLFERIGYFDAEMVLSEDTDWFFRVLEERINVLLHKEVVQFYRQHNQNITRNKERKNLYLLKAFKKSLDRRRNSVDDKKNTLPSFNNMNEIMEYWQHQ